MAFKVGDRVRRIRDMHHFPHYKTGYEFVVANIADDAVRCPNGWWHLNTKLELAPSSDLQVGDKIQITRTGVVTHVWVDDHGKTRANYSADIPGDGTVAPYHSALADVVTLVERAPKVWAVGDELYFDDRIRKIVFIGDSVFVLRRLDTGTERAVLSQHMPEKV